MRSCGNLAECAPGNIGGVFSGRGYGAGAFHADVSNAPAAARSNVWADQVPNESTSLMGRETGNAQATIPQDNLLEPKTSCSCC
eukprot:6128908-Pyramimonas_sp.AAC.1